MNVLNIANKNQFGMPRVRLFNTKNLCKTNVEFIKNNLFSFFHKFEQHCVEEYFISSVFLMLKCVENCDPRHPPKGCLGPDVKKFSSLLYTYNFL